MGISDILVKLQQLENAAIDYYKSKIQYLPVKTHFDFPFLEEVYTLIKLLPLNEQKIELMQRFQQNVFNVVCKIHPKLNYTPNFANDLVTYKPLIEKLVFLQKQASEYYKHYFSASKPYFDWQGFNEVHNQINHLPAKLEKVQLMELFEYGAFAVMSQIHPKIYMELSFQHRLTEDELSLTPTF